MFQQLVNHNDDIRRLVEKGYVVTYDSGYLVIRDIPYLDNNQNLQIGGIVTTLKFLDEVHVEQVDHQIFFAGSEPYCLDGNKIQNLAGGPTQLALSEFSKDVVVQRSFSNKPMATGAFRDFFEKIESYVTIISGPAIEKFQVTPYTFRPVGEISSNSVFTYHDSLTSIAEITDLSSKLENDVVAIIGLGGTGAYVLDFLVKTHVKEIRAFDSDRYYVHNAYRSPGKLDINELKTLKADVYQSRYENFRSGIVIKPINIDDSSSEELEGVTFVFVCVDKGSSRSQIFDLLVRMKIPFIDVGMGLNRKRGSLNGMIRTTFYSSEDAQKVIDKELAELTDSPDDQYKTNIQISELNALNACLAVIKFKQLRGFYFQESPNYVILFEIADQKVVSESEFDED